MKIFLCIFFFFLLFYLDGTSQYAFNNSFVKTLSSSATPDYSTLHLHSFGRKLFQRNTGAILGWQRGSNTSIEFGGEAHWRKLSLLKPHIMGATANVEYNFSDHIIGYKAGMWMKRGRVNLTYGGNVSYFNNFKGGSRFGIGPAIGFRLMGFHLINGYNILTKDESAEKENSVPVNSIYMTLRYYFPVQNKFTWDRKTMKKKRQRKKERAKRKKERQNSEKKGLRKLFKF